MERQSNREMEGWRDNETKRISLIPSIPHSLCLPLTVNYLMQTHLKRRIRHAILRHDAGHVPVRRHIESGIAHLHAVGRDAHAGEWHRLKSTPVLIKSASSRLPVSAAAIHSADPVPFNGLDRTRRTCPFLSREACPLQSPLTTLFRLTSNGGYAMPFSVTMPVTYLCGVTSKAGLLSRAVRGSPMVQSSRATGV